MSSGSTRRIQKEVAELMAEPLTNIEVITSENNLRVWEVIFTGPPDSPYQGGKFVLALEFSLDYPFKPPTMRFRTKIYHPNIDGDGNLCVGLLKLDNWKPSTKMNTVLLSIYDLLETPNPDDPLVTSIAEEYRSDRNTFNKKAADSTSQYAR